MANLDIVIRAQDKGARATIKGVRGDLDDLGREGGKSLKSLGTAIGTGLKVAAGVGVAGLALLGVGLKKAIEAGSDVEEMMGKFNVVFGDFAKGTTDALDELAITMRRNKFDLRGYASTFQDTFVPLGFARGDAAELSKQLTALTVDMASFNNVAESDVLAALQSALVGNHETMRQFGVIITQTTLNQELLNMGILGGVASATEAEKVQARLNLIMQGTADAQGDAVRTASGWANTMRDVQAAIAETVAEIGQGLLPQLTPMLAQFSTFVRDLAPKVITLVADTTEGIGKMTEAIKEDWGSFRSTFDWFKGVWLPGMSDIWGRVVGYFTGGTAVTDNTWEDWLKGLMAGLRTWARLIQSEFNLFFDGLEGLYKVFKGMFTLDWELWLEGVKQTWSSVWNMILNILKVIFGNDMPAVFAAFASDAGRLFSNMWDGISRTFTGAMDSILGSVRSWRDSVWGLLSGLMDFIWNTVLPAIRSVTGGGGSTFLPAGPTAEELRQRLINRQGTATTNNFSVNISGITGNPAAVAGASMDGVLSAARRIGR